MKTTDLIALLADWGGSDLYLKVGVPPTIRSDGELKATDFLPLTEEDTRRLADELMPAHKRAELERSGDAELAVSFEDLGRFRVNVYSQRGMTGVVIRRVITHIPEIHELGLPPVVSNMANERRGLVLLTGPSGTGKTTTIAAIIGHINRTRACHIVTLEDPIEVVHEDGLALIDQREVGTDMPSYASGLRHAVRQDPDVIFIGEIRDEETAEAAMQAAETGHLVISTMHTTDARETVSRLIDLFPAGRQRQARYSVASALSAVVCQRLVPRADGTGRVPAVEVMLVNGRVVDMILDPSRTDHIHEVIKEGGYYGMQTFDQALLELVRSHVITIEEAQLAASNRHDFMLALTEAQLIRRRA